MPKPTRVQIRAAVKALGISVPIYRVETIRGGLRLYLYGHSEPVEYKKPKARKSRAKPKEPLNIE